MEKVELAEAIIWCISNVNAIRVSIHAQSLLGRIDAEKFDEALKYNDKILKCILKELYFK